MRTPEERTRLMGEGRIKPVLAGLAGPSIVAMLSNALYNLVDAAFIGRLGTGAIGAVAVVFPITEVIVGIGLTFGLGGASYISRALGAGNREQANRAATTALFMAAAVGVAAAVAGLIYLRPLLRLFGATDTILPYAENYARILVIGAPIIAVRMTLNNIVRAEGNARLSMIAMMTGAGLNIVLDPIFMFWLGLGIQGAALATVVSQIVAEGLLVWYFFRRHSYLRIHPRFFTLERQLNWEVLKIGIPTLIRQLFTSFAVALLNNAAAAYGDAAVASIGLSFRILFLGMFPVFGFAQGFQPLAGYNYGARRYDRLFEVIRIGLRWATLFSVLFTVFIQLAAPLIVRVFSDDPDVIRIATLNVRAFHALFVFFGAAVIFNVLFQALGRGLPAAVLSMARQGIFLIPAIVVLPRIFGLAGVLFTQTFADFFTIITTAFFALRVVGELRREARTAVFAELPDDAQGESQ
ncbi:MAG: MATE family efflux transporter [Spirochaetaceae bacterium]|nr:MAG: MATE family efflux transporter [Spirochaetaceae bacterium]